MLYGYNKNQTEEIIGKYFDLEEKNATHYIDFKDDKTYYHYYKNEKIEKKHSGTYKVTGNKIYLYNWEEYSKYYLNQLSKFNKVEFGVNLEVHILDIDGTNLNTLANHYVSEGSYKKGEEVEKEARELEEFKKKKILFIILIAKK
ncbi:hypothetical protein BWG23_02325 [Flavobacterium oreochromis]|nr:hypothetical protein BWG23_02325 [Flavobacterium oreochromis]